MALSLHPAGPSPQHRTPTRTPMQHGPQNIANVVLGNLRITPEFPSFYPEDLIGGRKAQWLYVCQWCFRYTHELMKYAAHCKVCAAATAKDSEHPIGEVVYEKNGYAIWRIDGEEHKLYAQNLSLFAKLFLDTKSVFFDVSSFLYYLLVQQPTSSSSLSASLSSSSQQNNGASSTPPSPQGQVVGFYSKEKMSWDNNNLACILVFPPWQRKGLGQLLMGASYVLGRREGRFGGPEKPLSAKGLKSYLAYWCREVARFIVEAPGKKTVSVKTISDATWIMPEDVVMALTEMGCLEKRKTASGSLVVNKGRVREWADRHRVVLKPVVDVEAFIEEESELSEVEESSDDEEGEESP